MRMLIKKLANSFGYEIKKYRPIDSSKGFELFQYHKKDGTFDYEKYKTIQTKGNKLKIENIWVQEENIKFLAEYIAKNLNTFEFGICHGTRRGKEQEWFSNHLKCKTIGTEISDTAEQFPNTIQWDFHEVKPEWKNSVDFIYSNSFDHSYDPQKCLLSWMSCIKKGGFCILEHTSGHEFATELDPFGANISILPYLILTWGKGIFCVKEILSAPSKPDALQFSKFLVIQKF